MLQLNTQHRPAHPDTADPHGGVSLSDTINTITGILRRQYPIVIVLMVGAIIIGLSYLFTTPSTYMASATMVIDTRKVQLFQQQSLMGEAPIDAGTVQTEIEILKSQNVSKAAIRDLHLTEDPEFVSSGSGIFGAVFRLFKSTSSAKPSLSDEQLERRALGAFEARRTVTRVGQTYVMEIAFLSRDPGKAARIANAIADAYITDQLEAKYQATRRASLWLQDRIKELRMQATVADRAVVDFKQQNNINTVDPSGKLMNEQNMAEVNSQLILAHASTAEAKARLDRMNEVMRQPIPDSSVADALKSEVIITLRNKYLDLQGREALLSAKYGPSHLATVSLRNQMQEIRRNISDEMQKIAESYKSDFAIAEAREHAIKSSLDATVSESQTSNQAQIQLRELQSTAQSYRSMYDNFLQRYMESVQQQSFPITEARLISPAASPLGRSQPNTSVVLALTILGGAFASLGVALLREAADRVFRTSRQIEERLQVNCLAILPIVKMKTAAAETAVPAPIARTLNASPAVSRYAVTEPFSRFTEALRSIKVAVDLENAVTANKVIGFTSTLPNEGKSTTSANFAQLIAHSGNRVLLVDADLRNPSLSRTLADGAEGGLVDVLAGRKAFEDVIWTDPVTRLTVLPVGGTSKLIHTNEILGSNRVKQFFAAVRDQYDYVFVDLAPLAPVVDTRTTTAFIDSYVFVVEWGRTKMDVVTQILSDAPEIHERILGVVLNKADLAILGRYERSRSNYYYRKYYGRYGYTA